MLSLAHALCAYRLERASDPNGSRVSKLARAIEVLNGGSVQGDVACASIGLVDPLRFVVPEDGYYVFELGVVNVNAYFSGKSVGAWAFNVTVTPA